MYTVVLIKWETLERSRMIDRIKKKRVLELTIKILFFTGAIVALTISFFYLFRLPYTGDDRTNSMTKGIVWSGQTVRQHTYWVEKGWLDRGRFFPLGFYSRALFYYLPDLFSYRIFQILLNIVVCAIFAVFVQKISKRWYISLFALLMPAVFFQTRDYHDAITGFHGFLQFVTIFFFLSLICQIMAFERRKILFGVFSGIFFLASLLLYEVSYSFAAIFIVVALLYKKKAKERILTVLPHFIAIVIALIPTIYYKLHAVGDAYEGVTFSLQIDKIIQTFGIQLFSAMPLSYMVIFPEIFQEAKVQAKNLSIVYAFFYVLFAILIWWCFWTAKNHIYKGSAQSKMIQDQSESDQPPNIENQLSSQSDTANELTKKTKTENSGFRNLFFLGLIIWLAPAGLVALSIRYQEELKLGIGYLPVYIQYFGGICIAAAIVFFVLEQVKTIPWKVILSIGCTFCFTIAVLMTQTGHEISRREIAKNDLQTLSQYALEQGLMDDVEEDAHFLMLQGGLSPELLTEYFVLQYADKLRVTPATPEEFMVEVEASGGSDADGTVTIYPENLYVFYAYGGTENGVVVLAKATSIDFKAGQQEMLFKDRIEQVYLEQAKGFVLGSDSTVISLTVQDGADEFSQVLAGMKDLATGEDANSTGKVIVDSDTDVEIQRISERFSLNEKEKQFSPYQADSFLFTIKAGENPILLRHFSCWG